MHRVILDCDIKEGDSRGRGVDKIGLGQLNIFTNVYVVAAE